MPNGITLYLPYPPSVNHYWRKVGARMLISKKGREYTQQVIAACRVQENTSEPLTGRIQVDILAIMPDHRRRDLDNLQKALLDSLVKARVIQDDSQIDRLSIERGKVSKPGGLEVFIQEISE